MTDPLKTQHVMRLQEIKMIMTKNKQSCLKMINGTIKEIDNNWFIVKNETQVPVITLDQIFQSYISIGNDSLGGEPIGDIYLMDPMEIVTIFEQVYKN